MLVVVSALTAAALSALTAALVSAASCEVVKLLSAVVVRPAICVEERLAALSAFDDGRRASVELSCRQALDL